MIASVDPADRGDSIGGGGSNDSSRPGVDVIIVTFNSAQELPACLAAVQALDHRPLKLTLVDCASSDGSLDVARRFSSATDLPVQVVALRENLGFAGGMNRGLEETSAPFALSLNPDARPANDYIGCLLEAREALSSEPVGAVTGRLHRPAEKGEARILDACGMRLTWTWRHLDRGSGETDRGQYGRRQAVFGATGAASLWVREALDDVAIGGRIFDESFHSYREDAELCFRLQERGWQVIYEPRARACHRRHVLPRRRASLPAAVNFHSLKNRYLLRLYHQTLSNFLWTWPPAVARDLGALGYVLLREHSSLPAYRWLWQHRQEIRERRRVIQRRKRRSVDSWFLRQALPLRDPSESP